MQKLFPALSVRKQASRPAASLLVALVALVGAAWLPTPAQAAPAPEQFFNGIALPPPAGVYVSPALWHAAFANGIVIRDVSHQKFTQSLPLPPLGATQVHTFSSTLNFELSTDNGATFSPASGNANVSVKVTHVQDVAGKSYFDTEMTQLDLVLGTLLLRESPTLPSRGKTTARVVPGGYMIGSFFDIFTEVSLDGGASWVPAQQAGHVELRSTSTAPAVPEPTPLLPPQNGQYVSPQQWHALFAQGIVIKDVKHKRFTDSQPPPTGAASQQHQFGSTLEMQVSTDNGATFQAVSAPAQVGVVLTPASSGLGSMAFDTEMTLLNFTLPGGQMIRESPTLPSRGRTEIAGQADGTFLISSFFDIFTELSVDGGATWSAATGGPVRVELQTIAPEQPTSTPNLPPQNGQYVSPEQWHAAYANGIVISNVAHLEFLQSIPPPPPGGSQVHQFGSFVHLQVSLDGGHTFVPAGASANVAVKVQSLMDFGGTRFFDTEMLQLDLSNISGGGLPPGLRLRESPTKASLGKTSVRQVPGTTGYRISSFFDIWTELSLDGGQTWLPAVTGPATVGLKTPPAVAINLVCPAPITVPASGPAGAVVNFTVTASGGCGGTPTVICNPPSGSLFPVGVTLVTCTASDTCGNSQTCSFQVFVQPSTVTLPEYFFTQPKLPPPTGVYISPAQWHVLYAQGIVIRDIRHRRFTQATDLPPLGATKVHTFSSTADFDLSLDGGNTFQPASASVNVQTRITHVQDAGGKSFFDTEMLQLDLSGGSLPPAMRLRESPTLPSRGQTTVRAVPGGYMIGSFFDIWTELSMDNGQSWSAGSAPAHVELRPDPILVAPIPTPTPLLPPPNDVYVSPAQWHALYAQGIVIKDLRHKVFTQSQPPPPAGGSHVESFGSQLDLQLSTDGGLTFQSMRAPSTVQVLVANVGSGASGWFDTEMQALSFNLPAGGLPQGIMIRESPTEPSRGEVQMAVQSDGTYRVSSFFDIFTEVSLDGGGTWSPATNGPVRMELRQQAPEQAASSPNLPPQEGEYVSPDQWHALYANGIIITNVSHQRFLQTQPPPPPGGNQTESFGSTVTGLISLNGGASFTPFAAPAGVVVQVNSRSDLDTGNTRFFDTEMLALNLTGGSLPAGMRLRESPSKASLGRTSLRMDPAAGQYHISSFFDVFTEISMDNGQTWSPAVSGPATVRARTPLGGMPVAIACPTDIVVPATGPSGAVVTFKVSGSGGCGPLTITCTPPSGSTFPVGTTLVTCTAVDPCGNQATCQFHVTVRPYIRKWPFPSPNLPPATGQYVSPEQWHALYANGIVISNASHLRFTQSTPPPPAGGTQIHSFGSQMTFQVSLDGGKTFTPMTGNANVQVQVMNQGPQGLDTIYATEMLALDMSTPNKLQVRESPTKASTGETRIQATPTGFLIGSFFDIWTEVSLDGQSWFPAQSPVHVELQVNPGAVPTVLTPLGSTGDLPRFLLPTQNGLTYLLESKNDLKDPVWSTVSGLLGNGSDALLLDFLSSGAPYRYYRARVEGTVDTNQ